MSSDDDPNVGCTAVDGNSSSRANSSGIANFTRPGEFVYDISQCERDTRMTVSVTESSTGEYTVTIRYDTNTGTFDTTVAGGRKAIRDGLATTPVAPFVSMILFPSITAMADIGALPTERQLPVPGAGETASVEITETDSDSENMCYQSAWKYDRTLRYEDCVILSTRLKTAARYYSAGDAEPFVRIELVETTTDNAR